MLPRSGSVPWCRSEPCQAGQQHREIRGKHGLGEEDPKERASTETLASLLPSLFLFPALKDSKLHWEHKEKAGGVGEGTRGIADACVLPVMSFWSLAVG